MKSYGISGKALLANEDYHIENFKIKGFSVEPELFDALTCDNFSKSLLDVYKVQEDEFGSENLKAIKEENIARMPFTYDRVFLSMFMNPNILKFIEKILGKAFYLHLQNGIINKPNTEHHQSSWHRDFPYQDWVSSKPLGMNAFVCLTDFTFTNGATYVLPYSHKSEGFPSEEFVSQNQFQVCAKKGSVIFFDSMLYHRAGFNETEDLRIGVNNMFVVPIIKQQIDLANSAISLTSDPGTLNMLGVNYPLDKTVLDYRNRKLKKNEG